MLLVSNSSESASPENNPVPPPADPVLRAPASTETDVFAPPSSAELDSTDPLFAPPSKQEMGEKPDMTQMKQYLEGNLSKHPKEAEGFLESIEAGWQMSVAGLISRQAAPDVLLPENGPAFARIASQAATLAGDLPAMLPGAMAGGAGGAALGTVALPVVGTVGFGAAGAGAGAFALPTAVREILMQHYEKGDIKDFGDFWERSSSVFLDTMKSGVVGAATAGVGGVASKFLPAAAAPLTKMLTKSSSEVATMVTVGKALEGEVPNANDFLDAAVLVGGLHAVGKVADPTVAKMRKAYSETGLKPHEMIEMAQTNPTVRQDLLSSNIEVPKAFKGEAAVKVEGVATIGGEKMSEISNVLASDAKARTLEVEPFTAEAVKNVLETIGEKAETTPMSLDRLYTEVIDGLHPIKRAAEVLSGGRKLDPIEDPYILARLTKGSAGKAEQFLEHAPFKFDTLENTGKSFKAIMEPVKEDLDGFRAYAKSKRAVELTRRGIDTGIRIEDARTVVKAGKAKYDGVMSELQEFQGSVLSYLKDSGILSKEGYAAMRAANEDYVPFHRIMEGTPAESTAGGAKNVRNPVKKIEGSELKTVDPLEAVIKNTYTMISLAEKNRVATTLTKLAESNPDLANGLIERVTPKKESDAKIHWELRQFMKEHKIEGDPAMFAFLAPAKGLASNEIAAYHGGTRVIYKVAEELGGAFRAMDSQSMGLLVQLLAKPASWLRAGATLSPDFIVRNVMRDQLSAFAFSKSGYIPVVDAISGLGSLMKKDSHYQNWLKGGGGNAAMVAIDRAYIQENVFKLSKETKLIDKAWNVVKSPLELLRISSELAEESTRLGLFKKAAKGKTSANDIMNASIESREGTLDFSRRGNSAQARAMNMITAFWNAHVQGLDRTARAFMDKPAATTAKMAASITLPSVLLWASNKDDPRWKEIPRWQKDMFWIVMTKDHVWRIPKPGEAGLLFGSLPERVLEGYFEKNPKAFKDFSGTLQAAFTPSYLPTAAIPVVEHFANRSTFTDGPIVPYRMEGLLPEYQYTEYTSETAKALGKFVAALPNGKTSTFASPAVLENYANAWSGNLGKYALKIADEALVRLGITPDPVRPTKTLAEIPVIKAFMIRYPGSNAQSIQDFFDNHQENKKRIDTVRYLAKNGDFESMQQEYKLAESQGKLIVLDGMQEALANQHKFIRDVNKNPKMSPDEKRQLIDGVYLRMIETAKYGNQLLEQGKQ